MLENDDGFAGWCVADKSGRDFNDLNVGELAEVLGMTVSAVSHQLRVLKNAKLVRGTKAGKEVRYALDDNHVVMILECGLSHLGED